MSVILRAAACRQLTRLNECTDDPFANPPPAMPWNSTRYPASMRHLSAIVRDKAIAIANALLAEGLDEGLAIRIAIAKAEAWARRRGLPVRDGEA